MKNVHLIPTEKPSRLYKQTGALVLDKLSEVSNDGISINQHLYITSDEEIKEGDWVYYNREGFEPVLKQKVNPMGVNNDPLMKKIILTTDQYLIKDGVQAIDDKFLEWFVKNPSCEWVEYIVEYKDGYGNWYRYDKEFWDKNSNKPIFSTRYKIIIPQEEPKQETLEEAAEIEKVAMDKLKSKWPHLYTFGYPQRPFPTNYENDLNNIKAGLYEGAKWQAERMYSEEEVLKLWNWLNDGFIIRKSLPTREELIGWFEQFKKK